MAKFLKKFSTHSEYEAYIASEGKVLPNVSICDDTKDVHYNPFVETRVVAKFNVTSTSSPTQLCFNDAVRQFSAIEIDDVVQPSVVSAYTFSTTGEHTVKYTLTDPTSIGGNVFQNCSSLTSIEIPNNVTSIGDYAFSYCSGLTSIEIPDSVTTIGNGVFRYCYSLSSIYMSSGVTSIDSMTFQHCSGLTSINIPSGVTSIGSYAFNGCKNLTSIDIPDSVTSIGENAFNGCYGTTIITVRASTPPTLSNSNAFNSTGLCPICVPSGSVDAYKAASGWSGYADRIQAIP